MNIKYDFLVTEVSDKITQTLLLLQEHNEIDKSLTLRQMYEKYLHPNVIPLDKEECWTALKEGSVLNCFQFDSEVGSQAAKKLQPHNIIELADANGLMRLMTAEKGQESPMDKYARFKKNIKLWYQEMDRANLTKEEQKTLEPYFLSSYGVPPSQEQLMRMVMDKNICGFSLAEANDARKIVGKKQMSRIPELKQKIFKQAKSEALGRYVWSCGVQPQLGYSFSSIHAIAYSFIGYQTLYLATQWNPIYWNTACLIVNSGSLETEENSTAKEKQTDYAKVAKALSEIIARDINISLIDINKSNYGFEPDVENNRILYSLKALSNINLATVEQIKAGRPYKSLKDFMNRCPIKKLAMLSLIKSGAFDELPLEKQWAEELHIHPRKLVMGYYLYLVSDKKKVLNLRNFNGLIQKDLLPQSLDTCKRIFLFNKMLKANKVNNYYWLFNNDMITFFEYYFSDCTDQLEIQNGYFLIDQKVWDKLYQNCMDEARSWISENQEQLLSEFNRLAFMELWNKYAQGSISAWEMESLCFYYNEHELANVNGTKYGLTDFASLPTTPAVERFFKRNNKQIPIYKLYKIVGTVISKNDNHSSISLLTTKGVVTVKFNREYYAMYSKQLSEKQADGSKKVIEKGWFKRGTKIMCTGYRVDDTFITKTYKNTKTHQLYKITDIDLKGNIVLVHDRADTNKNTVWEDE